MERFVEGMKLCDERGFTSVDMAVALLLTLALLFSTAQVYRLNSASAEIQEVADVAALAAESEVADFIWAARKADAVVLTMTLVALSLYGVGVVALCLPVADTLAPKVLEMAGKVLKARNSFAEKAAEGLNKLQEALPFVAAAKAAATASANNGTGVAEASYQAIALLVPSEGEPIEVPGAEGVEGLVDAIDQQVPAIQQASAEAEEAAQKANEAKERGWRSDCGAQPAYCQYERAATLANLPESDNPLYRSVDAWSFAVALKRAQAYYAARLAQEAPESGSVEERARSALRKRFYAYASQELARGYVHDSEASFDAFFPELFCNTDQLRSTPLYTEAAYPVTGAGASQTMHAWSGCPKAAGAARLGSVAQLEAGGYASCGACGFTVASLGNVAAASTSIDNGFEHHYREVARAAADYERARAELDPLVREVQSRAEPLLEQCADLVKALGNVRIEAHPPGRNGAVALVANIAPMAAETGFESAFVASGYTLGARAAVAGATLLDDERNHGSEVMAEWSEGYAQEYGQHTGPAGMAYDLWTWLLAVYGDGQQALIDGVEDVLGGLPLASESGLGRWAAGALTGLFETAGLQPADMDNPKPVLVNTAYVAEAGSDGFAVRYAALQARARSMAGSSTDLFTSVVDSMESGAYEAIEQVGDGLKVAELEFPVGGMTVPIKLVLPPAVKDAASGLVDQAAAVLRGLYGSVTGLRVWQ